jgi:hypothetical protein
LAAADYFDTTPVFEECTIAVLLHKKEVSVAMRYAVEDAAAVEESMAETIEHDWYDAHMQQFVQYYHN